MTLVISVAGTDITDDVIIDGAKFIMANGPNPGDFEFRVKDVAKTYDFRAGQPCNVDFNSVRVFEGYVLYASQGHGFPVDDSVTAGPSPVERMWTLKGVDINILFRKRVIFDQTTPSNPISMDLAPGTSDLTYLSEIVDRLTLGDDNLTFDFHHVGSPNPDRSGIAISIGDAWELVMRQTAEIPGAIWGIRPPRTVYYEDDDTETAPFAISDAPDNVTSFGYSNFDWLHDGSHLCNDARIWGVGFGLDHLTYTRVQDAASQATHGRWENPNGWRYNLYKQSSVNLVANSLVYGSPLNLHGPKDDAMIVTCRVKKPGLMPGHKVRIISTVFGEEIVLPIRRYTITFVNRNDAFFDLEMTWEIDAPRSIFDYPPFPEIKLPPPPPPPTPCDDLGFALGWLDNSLGWQTVSNHPWLGHAFAAGSDLATSIDFYSKKRYFQLYALVGQHGDGVSGGYLYWSARHAATAPTRWVIQLEFSIPFYTMQPGFHLAPFPDFSAGIWWGAQSNDVYPTMTLSIEAFGFVYQLLSVSGGVNHVTGDTAHYASGTRFVAEIGSDTKFRIWKAGESRPSTGMSYTATGGGSGGEFSDSTNYGPNRPWPDYPNNHNYIYIHTSAAGGVGYAAIGGAMPDTVSGNPDATNATIRNTFLSFTTGATVGGSTSGYHEALKDGWRASLGIHNFRFVTLPDDFNFASDVPVDCSELTVPPIAGSENCESISKSSDTEYITTWMFATGSTRVSLEGIDQRLFIDYYEDPANHKIIFYKPVLSSAALYVCYQIVGAVQ